MFWVQKTVKNTENVLRSIVLRHRYDSFATGIRVIHNRWLVPEWAVRQVWAFESYNAAVLYRHRRHERDEAGGVLESAFLKKVISTFTGFLWVNEACLPSWPWVVRAGQNRQPERKKWKIEHDYARERERGRDVVIEWMSRRKIQCSAMSSN